MCIYIYRERERERESESERERERAHFELRPKCVIHGHLGCYQATFAVATGLSMKDMRSVFKATAAFPSWRII